MPKFVFSSDQLPAHLDDRSRFHLWRDMYTAQFGDAEFSYNGDQPFRARSTFASVGNLGITRMDMTMQRIVRTSRQVAADVRSDFLIGFNRGDRSQCLNQRGTEMISPPGQGCAGAYTNSAPLEAELDGEMALVGICVPLTSLLQRVPNAEDLAGTLLTDNPGVRHLGRYLDFLIGSDEINADPILHGHIETTLLDLVVLALGANGEAGALASGRGLRVARAREIIAIIQAHYNDPAFSPREVSRKLGLSQRYVQELLQESGASFTERMLELRLQKARVMLSDARNDRLKIGELALACGFGDVSYFNQAFRRKFGAAPSHFRGHNSGIGI